MVAGYAPWHNFVRIRKMLRKTPANAAKILFIVSSPF